MPRWAPTAPGSAMPSRAPRARSTAASRTLSFFGAAVTGIRSALQLVREAVQGAPDGGALLAVGAVALAQAVAQAVEQLHDVLDDDDELLGRLAVALAAVGGDRLDGVEELDGQRLGTLAAL